MAWIVPSSRLLPPAVLTLAPAVEISGEGVESGVELKAGVEATLLGREARGEVVLLSWHPE